MKISNAKLDLFVQVYFNVGGFFTKADIVAAFNKLCKELWRATGCSTARAGIFLEKAAACTTFAELVAALKAELVAEEREDMISSIAKKANCERKYAERAYAESLERDLDSLSKTARKFSDDALKDDFNYSGGGSSGLSSGPP